MVIARASQGEITIVDRLRDPVRLAKGLDKKGRLDDKVAARAIDALERFGQRLADVPRQNIRAVGTNTLRRIRHAPHFLSRARRALEVPIEILPGPEEARLVYLGVAHDLADDAHSRLVVDIGGGSTECVIGERFEPQMIDSLQMGCVTFSMEHFGDDGVIKREAFKRAETAARLELRAIQGAYRKRGWSECVGSSGTIRACGAILQANGWSPAGITLEGLRSLKKALISCGHVDKIGFEGLITPDRAAVLPAGVAVLKAVFQSLRIERMDVSDYALREGLLYDLLGRIAHEDVRDRTIQALSDRYHVDREQARRVEATALALFDGVRKVWKLDPDSARRSLSWAAALHEIGLAIGYSGYQKHGHYLLTNSNMPGFSREDQALLAALVRGHRRRLPTEVFEELPPYHQDVALQLCVLLRLAVCLNRGRSPRGTPNLRIEADKRSLRLEFLEGWLDEHPLTRADLVNEQSRLRKGRFELAVR